MFSHYVPLGESIPVSTWWICETGERALLCFLITCLWVSQFQSAPGGSVKPGKGLCCVSCYVPLGESIPVSTWWICETGERALLCFLITCLWVSQFQSAPGGSVKPGKGFAVFSHYVPLGESIPVSTWWICETGERALLCFLVTCLWVSQFQSAPGGSVKPGKGLCCVFLLRASG